MAKINGKNSSSFVGKTIVGIKEKKFNAYSKSKGKNVPVTEYKGSFVSSDGTPFSVRVSKSSDEKYKANGTAYWVEIAEFTQDSNTRNQR